MSKREDQPQNTHFVIVPSISDTTTKSVESHTKMRAIHAIAPEAEREKVMELAPAFRLSDFWLQNEDSLLDRQQ